LGVALIIGYRMKQTSWVLLAMIVFFTFLTFYSAYFNKVTDCGCFGDAIKLTPWQSFYKDLILLILIGLIFWKRHDYKPWFGPRFGLMKVAGVTVFMTAAAIYAINHLPFIDFRAYKVGNHIPTLMQNSEPLKYVYIMEKDGETFEFENYPTEGGYEYIESKLLNPDALPKITDLSIWRGDREYTDYMMTGNKLLIVFHQLDKTSLKNIDRIRKLTIFNPGFDVRILTSTGYEKFEAFRHEHQLSAQYYAADATVLKTIVRSNPGLILLKKGTVLKKWHFNDVPELEEITEILKRK